MAKTHQTGQARSARQGLSLAAWGAIGLGSLVACGCSHSATNVSQPHDPLYGILAPPMLPQPNNNPGNAGPAATPPASQTYNPNAISPSSNPATLAGMSWTGPNGRTLAIDDSGPPFLPAQLTSGSRSQRPEGPLGPNANPKVEQVPDANPAPAAPAQTQGQPTLGVTLAVQPDSATPQSTAEILARQLQTRGVVNQKQDVVPEGLHLTCYVSRGPTGGLRILEVTAADYATAARAILQQLENSR